MKVIVALAGNPNAGKTSLFNALTGSHQHVGNYPGVTVEKKTGRTSFQGRSVEVIDLPGTYSLTAYSLEERVALDFVLNERPDVVVDVVDAANLERNLYLAVQFRELGVPLVVALNMVDVAEHRGIKIDLDKLSERLGVPVVPTVARAGKGLEQLLAKVVELAEAKQPWQELKLSYGGDLDAKLHEMVDLIQQSGNAWLMETYPPRWLALKCLERDEQVQRSLLAWAGDLGRRLTDLSAEAARHLKDTLDETPEGLIADYRYGFITALVKEAVLFKAVDRVYATDKVDRVLLNRLVGPLFLLLILYSVYEFTFSLSRVPVGWFESFFAWLGYLVRETLPEGPIRSLVASGLIDGVGGVLNFVPLIAMMFFAIAILEDSGYMARIAFIMDRILRIFGLHGASVLSLIVGGGIAGGCAVPAVMGARTLRDPKERLATILVTPMMNCGAKLPVYALLIGAFFSHYEAGMFFILTLVSWSLALSASWLLRHTVLKGQATPFLMELPPYRLPTFKGLLIHAWERTWAYIRKAGTVILAISVLMWVVLTYPGLSDQEEAAFQARLGQAPDQAAKQAVLAQQGRARLANSLAGRIGRFIGPLTKPLGFDWPVNVALVGGFTAKEVVVATLATAYSVSGGEEIHGPGLRERLRREPGWSPLSALSLILFVMVYAPCLVTLTVIRKEAGVRWAAFSLAYNTLFAYGLSFLVFQGGRLLGLGGK